MFNLSTIIKNNNNTFYDYDTDKRNSISFRIVLTLLFSGFLGIISRTEPSSFLSAVVAVEAILAGFSFSIMFFLLSENNNTYIKPDSLEGELRENKLRKLSKEVFYNIAYFNFMAVLCVIFCLLLLLPDFNFENYWKQCSFLPCNISLLSDILKWVTSSFIFLLWLIFYFSLMESMYTFVRTVSRVNYYFHKKISGNNNL